MSFTDTMKAHVRELDTVVSELKKLVAASTALRKRKTALEKIIGDYLVQREIPGVKTQDTTVILEEKTTFARQRKEEKVDKYKNILEQHNLTASSDLIQALINVKGMPQTTNKIKIQNKPKVALS